MCLCQRNGAVAESRPPPRTFPPAPLPLPPSLRSSPFLCPHPPHTPSRSPSSKLEIVESNSSMTAMPGHHNSTEGDGEGEGGPEELESA